MSQLKYNRDADVAVEVRRVFEEFYRGSNWPEETGDFIRYHQINRDALLYVFQQNYFHVVQDQREYIPALEQIRKTDLRLYTSEPDYDGQSYTYIDETDNPYWSIMNEYIQAKETGEAMAVVEKASILKPSVTSMQYGISPQQYGTFLRSQRRAAAVEYAIAPSTPMWAPLDDDYEEHSEKRQAV